MRSGCSRAGCLSLMKRCPWCGICSSLKTSSRLGLLETLCWRCSLLGSCFEVNSHLKKASWLCWSCHEWTSIAARMGSSHSTYTSCTIWFCRVLEHRILSSSVAFHGQMSTKIWIIRLALYCYKWYLPHHRICNNRIIRSFCTFRFWICERMG